MTTSITGVTNFSPSNFLFERIRGSTVHLELDITSITKNVKVYSTFGDYTSTDHYIPPGYVIRVGMDAVRVIPSIKEYENNSVLIEFVDCFETSHSMDYEGLKGKYTRLMDSEIEPDGTTKETSGFKFLGGRGDKTGLRVDLKPDQPRFVSALTEACDAGVV